MGSFHWAQFAVIISLLLGIGVWLLRGVRSGRVLAAGALLFAVLAALAGLRAAQSWSRELSHDELVRNVPGDLSEDGFVTSATCRSCHPDQHASWHDSYHRTMTQVALPRTVVADFDNVRLNARGRSYHLTRRDDEFWVRMVDPAWEEDWVLRGVDPGTIPDPPVVERRIVMTTGSHHMQTYWVRSPDDGRFHQLPWEWLNDDRRWVPREDVFLRPSYFPRQMGKWHDNCIECHSVAGEPNFDEATGTFDPEVGELGIACEACHGPAEEHIRANHDPARRYRLRLTGAPDPTIVNPARLDHEASTHICAQCHSMNVFKTDVIEAGGRYRAGDDLKETRMVLRMNDRMPESERADWPRMRHHLERQDPFFFEGRFWPDGMARISGRENNAMTVSACFIDGELECLSCHSMHDSDPDDQLTRFATEDEACLQCHGDYREDVTAHTYHAAGSSGSRCYNCHMPHTTYGLLKGIRSHTIDSPAVSKTLATGRPNACNLCHMDKSLRWTADALTEWYGHADVELTPDQETVSAVVLDALTGDAAQRALAAWHLGWEPALAVSGDNWAAMYAAHLLDDPYAAVRYVAYRSLRRQPGFEGFPFDYVGAPEHRTEARRSAVRQWARLRTGGATGPEILLSGDGKLDIGQLNRLTLLRDDRPVELNE